MPRRLLPLMLPIRLRRHAARLRLLPPFVAFAMLLAIRYVDFRHGFADFFSPVFALDAALQRAAAILARRFFCYMLLTLLLPRYVFRGHAFHCRLFFCLRRFHFAFRLRPPLPAAFHDTLLLLFLSPSLMPFEFFFDLLFAFDATLISPPLFDNMFASYALMSPRQRHDFLAACFCRRLMSLLIFFAFCSTKEQQVTTNTKTILVIEHRLMATRVVTMMLRDAVGDDMFAML